MPIQNNLNKPGTHPVNYPTSRGEVSISDVSKDQLDAFTRNMTNAIAANAAMANVVCPQRSSVVEENFRDLQGRFSSMNKQTSFKVEDQELKLCVKAPEVNGDLPVFFKKDIKDTIDLSTSLPAVLQESEGCITFLGLLKKSFPKLTSSFPETKIPRFVFSSPVPKNNENKGNFFPQIESEGQIAYIAWDSSSKIATKGFKEKTCDVLLENKKAFSGVALSQDFLEGVEKGNGLSAHFMTSKITIIGILIPKTWTFYDYGRPQLHYDSFGDGIACDGDDSDLCCDRGGPRLVARGSSSQPGGHTPFGMLGTEGTSVSGAKQDLPDRFKNYRERLIPFCLEIIPLFSSEQAPVQKDDLEMVIEMQFQEKVRILNS